MQPLLEIERHSDRVVRLLGLNPGPMTLQGTNTYLVGTGASRMLVDTGEGVAEYASHLKQVLLEQGVESISAILLTHHHYDHVDGVPQVCQLLKDVRPSAPAPRIFKKKCQQEDSEYHFEFDDIADGQVFSVEGATLRAIATPGHTLDHICFLIEEEQSILCGDTVLGQGTCVFQNLKTYLESLHLLLSKQPKRLYPGHGPVVTDGVPFIQNYIAHRQQREQQLVDALQSRSMTSMEIVKTVYHNVHLLCISVSPSHIDICIDMFRLESICTRPRTVMFCCIWASCGRSIASPQLTMELYALRLIVFNLFLYFY
jgi:glyoxylase-like metal-dependent hydrolase (beta-lactamase superfamily II)